MLINLVVQVVFVFFQIQFCKQPVLVNKGLRHGQVQINHFVAILRFVESLKQEKQPWPRRAVLIL